MRPGETCALAAGHSSEVQQQLQLKAQVRGGRGVGGAVEGGKGWDGVARTAVPLPPTSGPHSSVIPLLPQAMDQAARLHSELQAQARMRTELQERLDSMIADAQALRAKAALQG